jgi:hypothetical protein
MITKKGDFFMKIVHIQPPYVFTDDGKRIEIDEIRGFPRVGQELRFDEKAGHSYDILAITNDSECVSGVCPIK